MVVAGLEAASIPIMVVTWNKALAPPKPNEPGSYVENIRARI